MISKNKKAFTLTELLLALAVVGTVAALSIPALMDNMNRRILASQLKNTVLAVQNLADEQLINNKTQTLDNTSFANPAQLLSGSNLAISNPCTDLDDCWPANYKKLSDLTNTVSRPSGTSKMLKNGVVINYSISEYGTEWPDGDKCYGLFWVDVNGKDKPNILGRDFFAFRITKKGKIVYGTSCNGLTAEQTTDEQMLNYCQTNAYATACLAYIQRNNWQINY
ncbi:MAG: prepilin-type N-terminal cleavage/methylation domain-containing protein [Candidatus Gastranaerophilales bacterium]|nr:prepilin-type N-terminal cleavage/methylation domain-containing protein [Candidatus Gastranaerophilales bacterium]